jgi:hypothetical protein
MGDNKSERFDWVFNDSVLKQKELVYSLGSRDGKFLYVYHIKHKYYLYINEIKEYSKVDLKNLKFIDSVEFKKLDTYQSAYWGNPWLIFDTKFGSMQTDSLNFQFSSETKILNIERLHDYIIIRLSLKSMMICDKNYESHLIIHYEDKNIPTDFLLIKNVNSFFIIGLRSIDNKNLEVNLILKIININNFQRVTQGILQEG